MNDREKSIDYGIQKFGIYYLHFDKHHLISEHPEHNVILKVIPKLFDNKCNLIVLLIYKYLQDMG